MPVLPWLEADTAAAMALLRSRESTSLFLLSNLESHGPRLGTAMNSGNYKVVVEGDRPTGVFALTRRGNLIVQFDGPPTPAALESVLDGCATEPMAVEGLLGDWIGVEPLLAALKARRPDFEPTMVARDLLFERPIDDSDLARRHPAVRLLTADDFDAWDARNSAFLSGEGLPVQGTREERRASFLERVAVGAWWGLMVDGELASMAAHNARAGKVAQIGGVYTPEAHRRRGYSRAVMETLLADSRQQGFDKLVLFTGTGNLAAQAMYRAMGFAEIGAFGMIFGRYAS